jgi:dihydrofolate synthase / folylpolyglutamate synthase
MARRSATAKAAEESPEYRATLDTLFARRRFGVRPGLEVIRALCEGLDHPETRFPSVHLTGSKGKGSTAAFTEAILRAHGRRTGLFTSPHLASYRERIQVDRTPIPRAAVVEGVQRIDALADRLRAEQTIDRAPTFFEVTTALGLDWFARSGVEVGVIEVGMGGRLDGTNVVAARVGVVTTIELEHTELLGATREAIAREKAGILKPGMTGLLGEIPPGPRGVLEYEADRAGVPLWHLGEEIEVEHRTLSEEGQGFDVRWPSGAVEGVELPLFGTFQAGNAALAIAAAARFLAATDGTFSAAAARQGLRAVTWPGRLERIARRPDLFYDVAHTAESARAVARSLAEIAPLADPTENAVVFGCLRGKPVDTILESLSTVAQTIVLVPVRSERAIPTGDLRAAAVGLFRRVVLAPTPRDGVTLARASTGEDGFTLVVGSDYLIGELLRPSGGEEPDLSDPGVDPDAAARAPPSRGPS